ncbi:TPA: flagellar export chaperone FliS [Clostridioides difficile]
MKSDLDFTKEELLLMLVDGAVEYTEVAQNAIIDNDMDKAHKELVRVQDIFTELMITLDQSAGQWAKDMYRVYDFIRLELLKADIEKDVHVIDEVFHIIKAVRDTWHEASIESIK